LAAIIFGIYSFIFLVYSFMASPHPAVLLQARSVPEEILISLFTLVPAGSLNYRHALASAFSGALAVLAFYFTALKIMPFFRIKREGMWALMPAIASVIIALSPQFIYAAAGARGTGILLALSAFLFALYFAAGHALQSKDTDAYLSWIFSGAAYAVFQPYGIAALCFSVLALMHSYKKHAIKRTVISIMSFFAVSAALTAGSWPDLAAYSPASGDSALIRAGSALWGLAVNSAGAALLFLPALFIIYMKRKRIFWSSIMALIWLLAVSLVASHGGKMHVSLSAAREAAMLSLPLLAFCLLMAQAYAAANENKPVAWLFVFLGAASLFVQPERYAYMNDMTAYTTASGSQLQFYGKVLPDTSKSALAGIILKEASVYATLGKREKAERMIDMAVKAAPSDPYALSGAADIYFGPMDEPLTGLLYLEMALESEPYDAALAKHMVRKAREYGDTARAGRWAAHYIIKLKGSPGELK